jgi:phospholipid-binding lipoprotein MlaA
MSYYNTGKFGVVKTLFTILLAIFLNTSTCYAQDINTAGANNEEEVEFTPSIIDISDITDAKSYETNTQSMDPDEFEGINRLFFAFNEFLDMVLIKPVTKIYEAVLPTFARNSIRSVLRNLNEPVNVVNYALQGNADKATDSMGRFITNTTVGLLGIMDVASSAGVHPAPTDFGLTLKKAGVQTGPYLVLPIIGPSSMRDAPALVVDLFLDPWNYYKFHGFKHHQAVQNAVFITRYSLELINERERMMNVIDQIERTSMDKYATIRSIYLQKR